ncbi:MAG: ABC transporter permease [Muribaculaceae bacterium]|nr:ABC transporter permease [Muribaculaceae bacterium]
MRLQFLIAIRYLFSPKRHNAVNVISMISVAGIAVATTALIVVLSVFNGFSDLAMKQLSRIDPPLAIVPDTGKVIENADSLAKVISEQFAGVRVSSVLKEQALASSSGHQMTVNVMGVSRDFVQNADIKAITIDGSTQINDVPPYTALSSVGVAINLDIRPNDGKWMMLFVPRRVGKISTAVPESSFRSDTLYISGVWQVEQEMYDTDVIMVDIDVVRSLLDYENEASSIYIYPGKGVSPNLQTEIQSMLPQGLTVKNRLEQQADSFKMISVEKWITFLMLAFILIIASFNIISTMSMLIIEKQNNTQTLMSLGASQSMVRSIYAIQGLLISIGGGILGLILGVILVGLQQHFGLISLGNSSMTGALSIDSYPVALKLSDIAIVALSIFLVGLVTATIASITRKEK